MKYPHWCVAADSDIYQNGYLVKVSLTELNWQEIVIHLCFTGPHHILITMKRHGMIVSGLIIH